MAYKYYGPTKMITTTITTKVLLAPNLTDEQALAIALENGCSGYYLTIPPSMQDNVSEGDTFPMIVEEEWPQTEGG